MSGAFTGFSETDIKNVQNGLPAQKQMDSGKQVKFTHKNKKSVKQSVRFDEKHLNDIIDIPEEAKLYKSEVVESKVDSALASIADTVIESIVDTAIESKSTTENNVNCEIKPKEINEDTTSIRNIEQIENKVDIENLQTRQKLIEEQNRMRKELIKKALVDKRKRTLEETQRLNEIQIEFKRLDNVLSNDVRFLRKKIEIASIDYMEAQKRYLRLEKEFLDAKLALHKKLEKKELLTEHLSRIIEQNEERKAEKLTELLNKLEMGDIDNEKDDKTIEQ